MGEKNISNTFEYFNPSPSGAKVGDCVIRALCKALNKSWEDVYVELCVQGFIMHDLPNSDPIWGSNCQSMREVIIMRLLFTIMQVFIIACGTFIIGLFLGLTVLTVIYISLGTAGLTILTNMVLKIRSFDGIMHIDRSKDNTVMQLEFCSDPRNFANRDELYLKVDTEATLVKGRRTNNELVEKALDEIEKFHQV